MRIQVLPLLVATLTIAPVLGSEIVFARDVKPILRRRCYECHGPQQQMGTLRLDQKERAMVAGQGEPAIVPGNSTQSMLYRRISGARLGPQMPLTGPLTGVEIATIKAWIDQGAKWPDEPKPPHTWRADARLPPLFAHIRAGNFSQVQAAVRTNRSLLNARSADGTTLLMQATLYGNIDDVRWLLEQGANPNLSNAGGVTAMMWAAGEVEKVRALIAGGANVNARSNDGQTALLIAFDESSDSEVVKTLLEHGAKATPDQGTDPLVMAARNADPKAMKLLAEQRGNKFPAGALTGAAASDCLPCVQMILAGSYNKNSTSSALRNAATTSSLDLMSALLAAGADVNSKDAFGATALMRAAYSDYAETDRVKLLLDRGADVNVRDSKGETALHIAKRKGATKVVSMLVRAGAKE
jgi:ankyrin repeat protein